MKSKLTISALGAVAVLASLSGAANAKNPNIPITMQELREAVTLKHQVSPLPSVPSNWNFAKGPKPSTTLGGLDKGPGQGYSQFNPWNHIDSVKGKKPNNAGVLMGDLYLAVRLKSGKWITKNFGPPCVAVTHPKGKLRERTKNGAACRGGFAYAGIGLNNWKNSKYHTHGWSPNGRINTPSSGVTDVLVWGTAKMYKVSDDKSRSAELNGGHYQYGVGADKRNPNLVGQVIPPVTHGRRKLVTSKWQNYFAHTMSPNRLKSLCQKKQLPPLVQSRLKGGC